MGETSDMDRHSADRWRQSTDEKYLIQLRETPFSEKLARLLGEEIRIQAFDLTNHAVD